MTTFAAARRARADRIRAIRKADFETYRDYILALHLNPGVRWGHAIGMSIGAVLYPLSAIYLSLPLFVAAVFFYYGVGYLSHLALDGVAPQPAKESWRRFDAHWFVIVMNVDTLLGRFDRVERALCAKYPALEGLRPAP